MEGMESNERVRALCMAQRRSELLHDESEGKEGRKEVAWDIRKSVLEGGGWWFLGIIDAGFVGEAVSWLRCGKADLRGLIPFLCMNTM